MEDMDATETEIVFSNPQSSRTCLHAVHVMHVLPEAHCKLGVGVHYHTTEHQKRGNSLRIEGAVDKDGTKPSIWYTYTQAARSLGWLEVISTLNIFANSISARKTSDKSTGDIASDQYHHYKVLQHLYLNAHRWS
ncbi:hypothetical protein Syun_004287 [Stephania yunnanensis]|uniref:Uncharacterized protein n=1 Tax=Stephania yunnanensis TaxID=152371 RepID=A0AAP0L3P6_9MAGN